MKYKPNKVNTTLKVVVTGEFYDDEATEETLRYAVEQDLEDAGFDVDVSLLKEQETEVERLKRPDCEHANHDGTGCLGYCGCEQDDEPIDACKQCEKYTGNICTDYPADDDF